MYPKYHAIIGFLFCVLLFLIFPAINLLGLLLIFLSTLLIDVDHYIYFVFKKKSFNLKKAYTWFKEIKTSWLTKQDKKEIYSYKWPVMFLHNLEFILLLIILCSFNYYFKFILIGVLLHLFLDYLELIYFKFPLTLKLSLIYLLIRNKNKKNILQIWD